MGHALLSCRNLGLFFQFNSNIKCFKSEDHSVTLIDASLNQQITSIKFTGKLFSKICIKLNSLSFLPDLSMFRDPTTNEVNFWTYCGKAQGFKIFIRVLSKCYFADYSIIVVSGKKTIICTYNVEKEE